MNKKGLIERYDCQAASFEETRYGGRGGRLYLKLQVEAVLALLGEVKDKRILELGIGTGVYSRTVSGLGGTAFGLDISAQMLQQVRSSADIFLIRGDIENLPIQSDTMDAVICIRAIRFLDDLRKGLTEVNRVLKPSGLFVFNFHNSSSLKWHIGEILGYTKEKRKYDMPYQHMRREVTGCGFTLVKSVGAIWLPYGLYKLLNRNFSPSPLGALVESVEKWLDVLLPSRQAQLVFMCCRKVKK